MATDYEFVDDDAAATSWNEHATYLRTPIMVLNGVAVTVENALNARMNHPAQQLVSWNDHVSD